MVIVYLSSASDTSKFLYIEMEVLRQGIVNPGTFKILIDFKVRGLIVVSRQPVRPAGDAGMAVIPMIRIKDCIPEQICGKNRFLNRLIFIADINAIPISIAHVDGCAGIHFAARGDHADRIGTAKEQAGFKEIRQEIVIKGDCQLMIINHSYTLEIRQLTGDVFVIAKNVLAAKILPPISSICGAIIRRRLKA